MMLEQLLFIWGKTLTSAFTSMHIKEMLNVICHHKNAKKNHNEIPLHTHASYTLKWLKLKQTDNTKWWYGCGAIRTFTHCWWNEEQYNFAKAPILWPSDVKSQFTGKDTDAGKD